jgi:hypothetical protein
MVTEIIVARAVLVVISILVIFLAIKLKRNERIGNQLFWPVIIFWGIVITVATEPSVIDIIMNSTALGNNAQFLLILSVGFIVYLLLIQVRKSETTSFDLHKVVRNIAISNFKQNLKNPEKVDVLIVICAKNESKTIGQVIDSIKSENLPFTYKILVVNDGSSDQTAQIAEAKDALVINHVYNLGLGGAIKTGFIISKIFNPNIVINIDADGQHDPKYIPNIVSKLRNNEADLVYGSRFADETNYDSSTVKFVGNKFYTNLLKKITKIPFTDVTSGYRGIKSEKINSIYFVSEGNFAIELAIRAARSGLKIVEISTNAKIRKEGRSQFHRLERFFLYNINAFRQIYYAIFFKPKMNY